MNKTLENFKKAMQEFDFEKVHKVMEFLNWKWYDVGVPSVVKMKGVCEDLFRKCLVDLYLDSECNVANISTGGFTIVVSRNHSVGIKFCLEDCFIEGEYNE